MNQTLWGEPRESLSHERSQGSRGEGWHKDPVGGSEEEKMGSTGQEQNELREKKLREPGIYLRNKLGACRRPCYLSAGSLASDKEEGACTPHMELPSPGLDSPSMGEAVLAPRPCFMAGHGFQKGQGMVAGRKASTPPQSTCLACPFLLK